MSFFKSWKTTLAGVAAIITGISLYVNGQTAEGITAIITGIGLLLAHDANVSTAK